MSEKHNKRQPDIVFLNVLFCFLVIFIHISSEVVTDMPKNTNFFRTVFSAQKLSSFVVQGFITLSGIKLFLNKSNGINYGKYYFSRFVRVVLPYIIWATIYYVCFCNFDGREFSFESLVDGILQGNIWAHFYFVIVLIQFDILTPIWMFLYRRGNPSVHIAFSTIITAVCAQYLPSILTTIFPSFPNFNISSCFLRYLIYWTAGCLIGNNYDEFRKYLKSNKIIITITFILCGIIYIVPSNITVGHEPVWLELFNIMYAMSAILFFYMLSQLFSGRGEKLLAPMRFIDRSSYMIYLVHCLIIVILNNAMTQKNILNLTDRFVFRAAATYTASILVCIVWRILRLLLIKLLRISKKES